MNIGLIDIVKIVVLCLFVWIFTLIRGSYTLWDTAFMIIIVIIAYFASSFFKRRK